MKRWKRWVLDSGTGWNTCACCVCLERLHSSLAPMLLFPLLHTVVWPAPQVQWRSPTALDKPVPTACGILRRMGNAQAEQMMEEGTHVASPWIGAILPFSFFPELPVFHDEVASTSSPHPTLRSVWEGLDNFQDPGEEQEGSLPALRQLRRPCVLQPHSCISVHGFIPPLQRRRWLIKIGCCQSQQELSDANWSQGRKCGGNECCYL